MEPWILPTALWLALMFLVVRPRRGKSPRALTRRIAFRPQEQVTADDLFDYLLSANLAVLEHDDFNQLESALSGPRVEEILARHWAVSSREDCLRIVRQRMNWLGKTSPEEDAAIAAWRHGSTVETPEYQALVDTCWFLTRDASVVLPGRIRGIHLSPVACDIAQVAYLVRLGVSAGHLSRAYAGEILGVLRQTAKTHFCSWEDYSLCTLIGMGLRCRIDLHDVADWYEIARSHRILLSAERTTLSHAAGWVVGAPSSKRAGNTAAFAPQPLVVD